MATCRICDTAIDPFMSFGRMPIANGFLMPDQFQDEYFFDLKPAFCAACKTFQIVEQPDPARMFHENYAFFTRSSAWMVEHFTGFAQWLRETYLQGDDPFCVEIGSNDGAMLQSISDAGIRHLGVEPSANVAAVARRHGVNSEVAFFGQETAERVRAQHGAADSISAANVMCHIPNLRDVGQGVDALLKDDGVFIFEDPYLGDVLRKTSYDQIYDEHVFLFSGLSVGNIFRPHGLELIDVIPQWTHGGSMRYVLGRTGRHEVSPAVADVLKCEQDQGMQSAETYDRFRENCERSRTILRSILDDVGKSGRRVVGYGATSKSTTVINYCGLGPDDVEFISDTTPIKQGKFSPGAHIPIRPYEDFAADYPDFALLFAWNHEREIMAKEEKFMTRGGQWIVFVPQPEIRK